MKNKLISKILQVEYHRNGIGGEGFHAILFEGNVTETDMGGDPHDALMLGVVFDTPGQCAIFEVSKLSDPKIGVRFGANSWRGDNFEDRLREAIENNEGRDNPGSIRVGPFAIPTNLTHPHQ